MARPPEGNAKEVIRRRRRVTTAASSDDSVVAHSGGSLMYLRHPWCAPPLAQTFPAASAARGGARRTDALARLGALVALLAAWFAQRALLASLCSLPRFRSPRFTNSGTAHGRSASSKRVSSAAATGWARRASTSEPVRERRVAASRSGSSAATKDTKNTKNRGPLPPPPPTRSMSKISTVSSPLGGSRPHSEHRLLSDQQPNFR